jgi:ketosteroid isomerase-like protein
MSENLDLVRSIYADWERGDYTSNEWADPEIEYSLDPPLLDGPASWTGLAGMAEGARSAMEVFADHRNEAEEYRELDEHRVLVFDRRSGKLKHSGIGFGALTDFPVRAAHLFHIQNGKVTRVVVYLNRERALADLGLEE